MSCDSNQTRAEFDDARTLHYRDVLRTLVDLAAKMATGIADEAGAPQEPGTLKPDHTARFERISRTIRRCILLDRKLAEPLPKQAQTPNRTAARKRILREVEDQIERHADSDHAETLKADLLDRLDSPDLDDEIDTRPIPDIINDICRDLGALGSYEPTYKRRTAEDVQHLARRAAEPPSTEPRTLRIATLPSVPQRPGAERPKNHAEAVDMVLTIGRIRDG